MKMGSLDRPHLEYLLQEDDEMRQLIYNKSNTAVFVGILEYSFGLI
jgi:hypothetical protein